MTPRNHQYNTDILVRGSAPYKLVAQPRENGRPKPGGRFPCAEDQAVPSTESLHRWRVISCRLLTPEPKRNRNRKWARVTTSPSKGRDSRRCGATRIPNADDQTRFPFLREVFPGYGLVVDPACGRRPAPHVMAGGVLVIGCNKPRPVTRQQPFAQPHSAAW